MKKIVVFCLILATAFAAFGAEFTPNVKNIPEGALKIHQIFLKSAVGDAYIVEAPDGTVSLVDTGTLPTGEKVLVAALEKRNIRRIDQLIISHFHNDHSGGALRLLSDPAFDVRKVICSYPRKDPAYSREKTTLRYYLAIKMLADLKNIPFVELYCGDRIEFGSNISALLVGSASDDYGIVTHNGQSMVFKLIYKDFSMLFTGDCSFAQEKVILKSKADLKSDVLKVAHHGGAGSTGDVFLDAVKAKVAITSQPEWLSKDARGIRVNKMIDKRKISYYPSWKYGDIVVFSDGKTFGIKKF